MNFRVFDTLVLPTSSLGTFCSELRLKLDRLDGEGWELSNSQSLGLAVIAIRVQMVPRVWAAAPRNTAISARPSWQRYASAAKRSSDRPTFRPRAKPNLRRSRRTIFCARDGTMIPFRRRPELSQPLWGLWVRSTRCMHTGVWRDRPFRLADGPHYVPRKNPLPPALGRRSASNRNTPAPFATPAHASPDSLNGHPLLHKRMGSGQQHAELKIGCALGPLCEQPFVGVRGQALPLLPGQFLKTEAQHAPSGLPSDVRGQLSHHRSDQPPARKLFDHGVSNLWCRRVQNGRSYANPQSASTRSDLFCFYS